MDEEKKSDSSKSANKSPRSTPTTSPRSPPESPGSSPRRRHALDSPRSPRDQMMLSASPAKYVTFEEIMAAANGVSNMVLAHEIAVDNEFRFVQHSSPPGTLEGQITSIARRAFWDLLKIRLNENPPDLQQCIVLLHDVKENLLSLLPHGAVNFRRDIEGVLDTEVIKQQIENDVFNLQHYSNYVIDSLSKLCAPIRDQQVAALRDIHDTIELFKQIFEIMDVMKMDMANFTIQQIRPYIQQQSVEYERTKFLDFLATQTASGVDGLEVTRQWIMKHSSPDRSPAQVLNESYLELVEWPENTPYPETILLDAQRFYDLHCKLQWLSLMSSILIVTQSIVGELDTQLKDTIKDHVVAIISYSSMAELQEAIVNVKLQVSKDVSDWLIEHGSPGLTADKCVMLEGQIEALVSVDHSIRKLTTGRLKAFLGQLLASANPAKNQIPPGLSSMSQEVSHVCGQFLRLVSHNRSVYGQIYVEHVIKP